MNRRANEAAVGHRTCFIMSKEKPAVSQIVTRDVNISGPGSFHNLNRALVKDFSGRKMNTQGPYVSSHKTAFSLVSNPIRNWFFEKGATN